MMTFRTSLLSMTAAAALLGAPALALAQQGNASTTPHASSSSQTTAQGTTGTRDASGGVMAQNNTSTPRDGTPGNPPSTATQRAVDNVTGNRTPADGTPGNPPGTAAGRAMDRTLGTNTTGANPSHADATTPNTGTHTNATNTNANSAAGTNTNASSAAGTSSGAMAIDSAALHNGRRASKIIGSNIYNDNNESIGEVEDIMIPTPSATSGGTAPAPVAIISVGGFLGIGAKLVAVPYDRLQMNSDRNRWTLSGATKESLTALPTFNYDSATPNRRG